MACPVVEEEPDDLGDILRTPHATERVLGRALREVLLGGVPRRVALDRDEPRRDDVGAYPVRSELDGE